jgi:hypothetical protein
VWIEVLFMKHQELLKESFGTRSTATAKLMRCDDVTENKALKKHHTCSNFRVWCKKKRETLHLMLLSGWTVPGSGRMPALGFNSTAATWLTWPGSSSKLVITMPCGSGHGNPAFFMARDIPGVATHCA